MYHKTIITSTTLIALGACSGSGSGVVAAPPTVTVDPATVAAVGANTLDLEASFDADSSVITVDGRDYVTFSDGGDVLGPLTARRAAPVNGDDGDLFDLAIHGETSSGAGTVFQVGSTLDDLEAQDGFETVFVELTRNGETFVPTSGSAEYTGSYMGSRYVSDNGTFHNRGERIFGDVLLTADFGDTSTISGNVTGRNGGNEGFGWQDMDLQLANIENGGFSGVATGGGRTGRSTSGGAYSGILTGAGADEAIGGLSIQHENGDTEIGVFVAE